MNSFFLITQFFFLALACSFSFFTIFVKREESGHGFFKLSYLISLAFLIMGYFALKSNAQFWNLVQNNPANPAGPVQFNICFLFFLGTLIFDLVKSYDLVLIKNEKLDLTISKLMFGLRMVFLIFIVTILSYYRWGDFIYLISTSLLLGSIIFAMTLGHWYLVVPKMSNLPLIYLMKIFTIFFLIKICFHSFYLFSTYNEDIMYWELFDKVLILMRWGWGFLILGVGSFFSYKLIKMRSLQSATGLLYAMVFFIMVGELISLYFYFDRGLFI
jgi:hypothetical protein